MQPWQPQPYASVDIDEHLYLNPPAWDLQTVGWGDQRRYRIGDVTFDRASGLLYCWSYTPTAPSRWCMSGARGPE